MSLSGAKGSQSSKVKIPKFLRPLYRQGAEYATQTMGTLNDLLAPGRDFVANFTPQEEAAQILGTRRALGEGGFFPTAQETFLSTAEGTPISEYLPQEALSTLEQLAAGGSADPAVLERLRGVVSEGLQIPGMDTLSQIESGINPITRDALEATARGDFLHGGQGFDQAIEAAMRRIQPQLLSTFGGAGPGGGTGALAQTAIAQAVGDIFAGQYGQERGRQLGAAESLAGLDFTDRGQRADIASTLASLGLSGAGMELSAADLLSRIGESDAATRLSAAGRLGDYAANERGNQLDAAAMLPDIAEADIGLLSRIGESIRGMEQAEIDAPIDAQMRLLSAVLGLDLGSLLGSSSSSRGLGFSLGG